MENFINIIFDNKEEVDDIVVSEVATMASPALLESETNYTLGENDNGQTMLTVETHAPLDEEESDLIAEDVANKLFDFLADLSKSLFATSIRSFDKLINVIKF